MKRKTVTSILLGFALSFGAGAFANTEVPAPFDARSAGMGGTGAAYLASPTATYVNPATLDEVRSLTLAADITPFRSQAKVPLAGSSFESTPVTSPMFFVGGAYRAHRRVVVGLAAYTTAGTGCDYENVHALGDQDIKITIAMLELAVPVSIRLLDNLSLAASWRGTYLMQTAHQPVPTPGGLVPVDQDLSGFNYTGLQVGLYYRPLSLVRVGLSYRSKVTVDTEGKTKMGGQELVTKSSFAAPHTLRAGASVTLLGEDLLVAADLRYQFFKDSNPEIVTTTEMPTVDQVTQTPLHWKNAMIIGIGAEYKVLPYLAARVGYSLTQSASNTETASFAGMSPGILHGAHVGGGLTLGSLGVDLAFCYIAGGQDVKTATANNLGTGSYKTIGMLGTLSANYRL